MRYSATKKRGMKRTLEEIENDYILNVLSETNDNKTHAAEILGIDRKTLREKLKKMGYYDTGSGEK